jgi:hypothetical protein
MLLDSVMDAINKKEQRLNGGYKPMGSNFNEI